MPHDDRSIEVYLDDAHLCTAYPQGQLSDEQREEYREHARAEAKQLRTARRRATRRARSVLAPLSEGQAEEAESKLVPRTAGGAVARRHDDEMLRRRAPPLAIKMAVVVVTVAPIVLVYPFAQRHFVKGVIIGAVKG